MLLKSVLQRAECVTQNPLTMYLLTGTKSMLGSLVLLLCYYYVFKALKNCYILLSAADGPDFLAQELDLVKNINSAVKEERYKDAGMIHFYEDRMFYIYCNMTRKTYIFVATSTCIMPVIVWNT